MITRSLLWLRSVLLRGRLEREMQAEMAGHIERSVERLVARGLSLEDARRQATREFGNVAYLQEEGRLARGTGGLDTLLGDVRFALRHFVRHPLSTLTMVGVLSIGIAINVVFYTMVQSFTDRPPSGLGRSNDVVRIRGSQLGSDARMERAFTMDEVGAYAGLRSHFSAVAAWTSQPVTASAQGVDDFTITATFVTDDFFQLLGVQPVRGRGLAAGETSPVAVMSHAAWTRAFAQDPGIVGRTVTIGELPVTIVGVAPPRFRGAAWEARNDLQLWLPLSNRARIFPDDPSDAALFLAIARLQPGRSREAASAAARVVAERVTAELAKADDDAAVGAAGDPSVEVVPLLADNLEPGFEAKARFATLAFSVLGVLTLLVTCANVGALQTGLALARRREIAIRISLGAQRARVVRQLVTESLLLSLLAAAGAVAMTLATLRALLHIVGTFSFELAFDGTAIFFTVGVALAAGVLFGLSPALHATRMAVAGALRDSAAAVAGGRARLQRWLVVTQIALTQPLAVCVAALVFIGIADYRDHPPNPHGERIVQLRLASDGARGMTGDATASDASTAARERRETERLVEALRALPGVTHATMLPERSSHGVGAYTMPNGVRAAAGDAKAFHLLGEAAMPGYLALMGTPLVLGRDLEPADTAGYNATAIPIVIGDDMARRLWGDASPIGQRVVRTTPHQTVTLEVVGVYRRDVAALGHARSPFTVFVPPDPGLAHRATSRLIMLRVAAPAESIVPAIRTLVRAQAPRAAIMELRTLAALQEEERYVLWGAIALFSTGGLVVLLLCALGLYAVVAFAVGQRSDEIAVRMAIGARAGQIVQHFAADGVRLTTLGIVAGLPLSVLGLHQLISLAPGLPDVKLSVVMTVVALGVLAVAGVASWLPASRAALVDPATILRRE